MKKTTYRGFEISPVFDYSNGTSDFQISEIDNPENNDIGRGTLATAKEAIDTKLDGREDFYTVETNHGLHSTHKSITKFNWISDAVQFASKFNGELSPSFSNI